MDIQPASGYAPHVAAPGGSTPGESITDLAQQHGVSRESLLEFVRSKIQQTRQDNGEPPLDQATLDHVLSQSLGDGQPADGEGDGDGATAEAGGPAGYTSSARSVPERTGVSGSISVFA